MLQHLNVNNGVETIVTIGHRIEVACNIDFTVTSSLCLTQVQSDDVHMGEKTLVFAVSGAAVQQQRARF
jgi:hypothetical protein